MVPDESALLLVRETLIVALKIAVPILGAGVLVGLVVSIFQSVTSIQDQTLTFVPKIIVMVVAAGMMLPWIVQRLLDFTSEMLRLVQ
jgi:flagellar biosynthesis protein FliQ